MTSAALSLIVPVRGTGPNLEYFLGTLATQTLSVDTECIFVVAGDPALQGKVAARVGVHGIQAEVISSASVDIAIARREGLAHATGDWVTFPNARDGLGEGYVAAIRSAVDAYGDEADVFAVPSVAIGRSTATNPAREPSLTRLDEALIGLPSDVSRLVFRRRPVPASGTALGSYADVLLILDLLETPPKKLRVIEGARYLRRPMPSTDPQTDFIRRAGENYLAFLDDVAGRVEPDMSSGSSWRHRLAAREFFRLVEFENATTKRATTLAGEMGERFRAEPRGLLLLFDEDLLARVGAETAFDERRDILLGLRGQGGVSPVAHIVNVDVDAGLVELRHSRWEAVPDETVAIDGEAITPAHGKTRVLEAFGIPVLNQRIIWVPATGRLLMSVADTAVTIALADGRTPPEKADAARLSALQRRGARKRTGAHVREQSLAARLTRGQKPLRRARATWLSRAAAVRVLAHMPVFGRQFRDAWLLMDRADMARDNAEHMYRWLREHHPEVNAWFVLRSDSPDFARLKSEGFRMVEYGSLRHQILLNNTKQYLSSHVGIDVSRPIFDRYLLRDAPWTFTFLQHGVIHNDLSLWLNRQKLRLFIASTHQEYAGLAGDGSPYVFTDREVRLTGLPRFDKLRRIADANPVDERRTIVIAPTWRNGLFQPAERTGQLAQAEARIP
ncbi:CDP-glycerol glycerophosphotransferase family protein [Microbacterium elymi]|uniref:CDP-glycerol glycerophosphotransferase family protein n=1 Tax=Microbacterium elymi TaxID=2909587 RepID=A0ABY5NKL3_9MICO|nr:CDP-glycerol glycerophosphotransferase family protein [Microbacterium elymi]UUT35721.1 CDP-glycerol glycerophosphotransferase family protein [Microbacterium elymi]